MRVVSGRFRGKALTAPPGANTRPTSDRARQAVFNVLEHAAWSPGLRDRRVIDLFAGSRALAGLAAGGWLADDGLAVFERGADEPDPELPGYEQLDARDYGAARVLFL